MLKAREELQYQLAFLSSELRQIFSNAPAILSGDSKKNQKRKPVEDDCPICCMEFEPDHEEIVYCQSACGNNVHKECFDQWASSRQKDGSDITCPFCRSRWVEADEAKIRQLAAEGETNKDGYVNIAQQLGISGRRGNFFPCILSKGVWHVPDFNSYHPYWVRRQQQNGADVGDWDSPFDYWDVGWSSGILNYERDHVGLTRYSSREVGYFDYTATQTHTIYDLTTMEDPFFDTVTSEVLVSLKHFDSYE